MWQQWFWIYGLVGFNNGKLLVLSQKLLSVIVLKYHFQVNDDTEPNVKNDKHDNTERQDTDSYFDTLESIWKHEL